MKLRYQLRGLGIGIIVTALLMGVTTDNKIPLSDAEIKMRALELGMVDSDSLRLSDIPKMAEGSSEEDELSLPEADGTLPEGGDGASEPGAEGTDGADSAADSEAESGAVGDEGNPLGEGGTAGDEGDSTAEDGVADDEGNPAAEGSAADGERDSAAEGSAVDGEGNPADGEGESGDAEGSSHGEASGDLVTVVIERGATSYRVCQELERLGLVEDAARFDDYLCDIGYSKSVRQGTFQIPLGTSEEEIAKIITGNR